MSEQAAPAPIPVMRPWFGTEEQTAAADAVASGWVAQGPRVQAFEEAFRDRVGAGHAVATSSCTTALHLALVLLGIGRGDEVVVPSLSFIATASVVHHVGAVPVFADVDAATQNVTPETIAAVVSPATKAVVLVHQAGMPADVAAVDRLCRPRGIAVVEDAACAIGSTIGGRLVGHGSELAAFSFHPRKLVTTGEGGMLVTGNRAWADRARRLREHGMSVSAADRHRSGAPVVEEYVERGFNYRMTDVQAAIGIVQLGRLDEMVARRRALAARYRELFGDLPVGLPGDPPHGTTNFQSYCMHLPDDGPATRDELMAELQAAGISSRRGIMATHLEPAFADRDHAPLPITERLARSSIILPLFHQMTEADQDRVAGVVRRVLCGAVASGAGRT